MRSRGRAALSCSKTIATLALMIALGGTSYAAIRLGNSSVKTRNIANGAVTSAKIRNGAVTGSKLGSGTVTSAKMGSGARPRGPGGGAAGSRRVRVRLLPADRGREDRFRVFEGPVI